MSTTENDFAHVKALGKSNYEIAEGDSDIRGWTVKNAQGNSLTNFAPICSALIISEGVIHPGTQSSPFLSATAATSSTSPGLMM